MLIGSTRVVRVFASSAPVDLRKRFDGLFALARDGLGQDPMSGDLYLYVNRHRTRCKVLFWDGTGLCICIRGQPAFEGLLRTSKSVSRAVASPVCRKSKRGRAVKARG